MYEKNFNLAYIIMLIDIFPLIIFILSALNAKIFPVPTLLNEINKSLNDYPISQFQYLKNCSKSQYSGYLFYFPGSQVGCSCADVSNYNYPQEGENIISIGICDMNQTLNGCKNVPPIDEKELKNWGNGEFCSKKYDIPDNSLKGYLKFLNNSVLENEECQKGYKKCGKLDDMGNYLCLPENEECPINDIIFSDHPREDLENLNYTYTNLGDKYFYYTNSSKDKPVISKLKVVEGKLCVDKSYFYTDYPQYILDENFDHYGCKIKIDDQLYENIEELDYLTKGEFYNYSGLYLKNEYNFLSYDYPFNLLEANMFLYPKRYIGFDKKCLMENGAFDIYSETKIKKINESVTYFLHVNNFTLWFSIISFILGTLFYSCLEFDEEKWNYVLVWVLLITLFYISMGVPIYICSSQIKEFTEFPLCGNNKINSKLDYYNSIGRTLKKNNIISIIILNLEILFAIIIIIIRYFFQKEI